MVVLLACGGDWWNTSGPVLIVARFGGARNGVVWLAGLLRRRSLPMAKICVAVWENRCYIVDRSNAASKRRFFMRKNHCRFQCPDSLEVALRKIAVAEYRSLSSLVLVACESFVKQYLAEHPELNSDS